MNKQDKERLDELLLKIWSAVALKSLENENTPDILPQDDIESHKGRIDKALRLLNDYIAFFGKTKNSTPWAQEVINYKILRMDESKVLARRCDFTIKRDDIFNEIYVSSFNDEDGIEKVGYQFIDRLHREEILHVYWYPEQYHNINGLVYPKDFMVERIRMILRAIVEHHFQRDFRHKVEKYLNLPEGMFKDSLVFPLKIRNHAFMAYNFQEDKIFGKNGYLDEYEHYVEYFTKLSQNIQTLKELTIAKGGYAKVVEEMRRTSLDQLAKQAPLLANLNDEDNLTPKLTAKFILHHSDVFNYEYLYSDNPDVPCISDAEDNTCSVRDIDDEEITFLPDEKEVQLIKETV